MPKRSGVGLAAVADHANLLRAFHLCARGKGDRWEVRRFCRHLDDNLAALHRDILAGVAVRGDYRRFVVQDPKERTIHAACFRERVLHHALIAVMEPHFERGHIHHSYACRPGKGTLSAVQAAQHQAQHGGWHLHLDVRSFFASIDHAILKTVLRRRFKDPGLLGLCNAIVDGFVGEPPGTGLPIGSLTSQHFANWYLAGCDRFVVSVLCPGGYVRYMDDLVLWAGDRPRLQDAHARITDWLATERRLTLKPTWQLNRSARGLTFCGFRILPHRLLLTRRKRRRYAEQRQQLEAAFAAGVLTPADLQRRLAASIAVTAHADAAVWRREELRRHPMPACCLDLPTVRGHKRLQPRQTRRQLEQHGHQPALRQSQQEHAGQQQQQSRLPPRPSTPAPQQRGSCPDRHRPDTRTDVGEYQSLAR